MSKNPELRIGLTPAFKRIAHYYLCLGYGVYYPQNHPHYDCVVVRELYAFNENPRCPGEHAGGTVVEFFQKEQRCKWIEFRCQAVGGGGQPILRSL